MLVHISYTRKHCQKSFKYFPLTAMNRFSFLVDVLHAFQISNMIRIISVVYLNNPYKC